MLMLSAGNCSSVIRAPVSHAAWLSWDVTSRPPEAEPGTFFGRDVKGPIGSDRFWHAWGSIALGLQRPVPKGPGPVFAPPLLVNRQCRHSARVTPCSALPSRLAGP